MREKLGRNDPCHCGSGKKYKHCHLDQDERERRTLGSEEGPESGLAHPELKFSPTQAMLMELAVNLGSKGSRLETPVTGDTPPLAVPDASLGALTLGRIQEAWLELENHRRECVRVLENEAECWPRARALFEEPPLKALRFSVDEIRSACAKAGESAEVLGEVTGAWIQEVLPHLATREVRRRLSVQLLTLVPDCVGSQRYVDGWILAESAWQTFHDDPATLSLGIMMLLVPGVDAIREGVRERYRNAFAGLGMDLVKARDMSPSQMEDWFIKAEMDPEKAALMKRLFGEGSLPGSQSLLQERRSRSNELLRREDATHMLLTPEESLPWATRLRKVMAANPRDEKDSAAESEAHTAQVFEEMLPIVREMASTLFTPERIRRLAEQLRAFEETLFANADREGAELAHAAAAYVEHEDKPRWNTFIVNLCFHSCAHVDPNQIKEQDSDV
jgi:hypothetical protein